MTVDDLLIFYNVPNDNQLFLKTKIAAKSTLSTWRANGIPEKTQSLIEIKTKGALKADLSKPLTCDETITLA